MTSEQSESGGQQRIDVRNNPESRAYAAGSTQQAGRANDGGAPPREAPAQGEMPDRSDSGTRAGNPVAGLEISPSDRAAAKIPGEDASEADGPGTGHS